MAHLRLFASARECAGTAHADLPGTSVGEVIDAAVARFGEDFARLLPTCRFWVNGSEADPTTPVGDADEVAVLPPVSGGCEGST
jgi:molybdopterin converting factor small subunit